MSRVEITDEEWRREVDAVLARSRELLSTSRERRERAERTVAQATSNIRRTLLRLRSDY